MDFTNLVVPSGIEKDTLGSGGLSRINVGHNTDVTVVLERELSLLCRIQENTQIKDADCHEV